MRFCHTWWKCVMFARLSARHGIRVDAKRNPRGQGMHSIMQDTRITKRRYSSRVSATKSVSIDCGYCENYHSPSASSTTELTDEELLANQLIYNIQLENSYRSIIVMKSIV